MRHHTRITITHTVMALAAFTLGLAPLTVEAATLPISNVPLSIVSSVKPNIMYTLDNSGSMQWAFMPDQDLNGAVNTATTPHSFHNCYFNSTYNDVYYNPTITYTPPVTPTGAPYPNASFTAAYLDGFYGTDLQAATTLDLATDFMSYDSKGAYYFEAANGSNYAAPNAPSSAVLVNGAQAAFYYVYSGVGTPSQNVCYPDSDYTKVVVSTTSGPGGTDETGNFANWFQYYRTRIQMTKTSLGQAFSTLNTQYRVGFVTINTNGGSNNTSGANFLNIADFTPTQKTSWFNILYGIIPTGSTPLQAALQRDGEYYQNGAFPGATSSTDPIQYSCQQNFTVLSTDGFWNAAFTGVGDQDATVPTLPAPVSGLTTGSQWPTPWWEGSTATSNTLADVAMKYWVTDLRPTLTNNVPPNPSDPAIWQHMTTFTIGLGAQGQLVYPTDFPNILSGTKQWPVPVANQLTTIDDLWHAAVNGHGDYLSASSPAILSSGLRNILSTITNRVGSASAVAASAGSVSTSTHLYAAAFNSADWSGQFLSYPLLANGTIGPPDWNSGALINSQNWNTGRVILSATGGAASTGIPFRWASLTAAEQTDLNTTDTGVVDSLGSDRLNYLRGDPTNEGAGDGFRVRPTSKLGDIVDSSPTYVGAPDENLPDSLEPQPYSAFEQTYANRTPIAYVGANDGMVHGFEADTGFSTSGTERVAFVPSPVYPALSALTDPNYAHQWYVDGSPNYGDVYWGGASGAWHTVLVGGLAGGGEGYYALDVTNPTNFSEANAASLTLWEFTSANDADLGDTYGMAPIVLLNNGVWAAIFGNGYNSTQNTGATGHAVLYVVNIQTGALIAKIDTGVGTTTNPNGLSEPAAIDANGDDTTDYVYAGDLYGNLWKFDLTSTNPTQWKVAYTSAGKPAPLYSAVYVNLTSGTVTPQPITEAPEIGLGPTLSGGTQGYMVYFGTGSYFLTSDPGTTSTQTFYGIWDNGAPVPNRATNATALVQQTITSVVSQSGNTFRVVSSNPVTYTGGGAPPLGWYLDLTAGERSVSNSLLSGGHIEFTTIIPSTVACTFGGTSWFMDLDAMTGGSLATSPFDTNGDGTINNADLVTLPSGATAVASGVQMTGLSSGPTILAPGSAGSGGTGSSGLGQAYFDNSNGNLTHLGVAYTAPHGRVAWEELQ